MRVIILLLLFLCSNTFAEDFNRALNNTCIIKLPVVKNVIENGKKINKVMNIEATGCVFKNDDKYYYVLTCGHKFEDKIGYKLVFIQNGTEKIVRASQYCQLDEIKDTNNPDFKDYAILFFYKKAAEQINLKLNPIPISLEPPDINEPIYSVYRVGETNPRVALSEFKFVKINEDDMFITPYPFPGTSGASIFNKNFSKIYGIHISSGGLCTRSTFIARHYEQSFGKSITQN